MKKEYISPATKLYAIKINNILQSSEVGVTNAVGSGTQLSKGNSIWSFMDGDEEEQ